MRWWLGYDAVEWDEGERRRPEYFGGEYRYYPTPVREGIYSIATDANRLRKRR